MKSAANRSDHAEELLKTIKTLLAEKRWDDAISIAAAALTGDPQNAGLHALLAAAQSGAGRPTEALKAMEELASQQLAHGRLADAQTTADELVRIAPQWAESYNTRGAVLLKRRKPDQAESDFRAALRLAPDEPVYMNNLGLALHRRGKRKEAIEAFRNASIKDPSFAAARNNLFLSTRVFLWGGGLVLLVSIALHAVYVSLRGDTNGRIELQLLVGVLAIIAPVLLVRYWLNKRSLDPIAQTLYDAESRRVRFRPSTRTTVKAGGFLLLLGGFVAGLLTNQLQLAAISLVLAILWLHRGWTIWRYAGRLLGR